MTVPEQTSAASRSVTRRRLLSGGAAALGGALAGGAGVAVASQAAAGNATNTAPSTGTAVEPFYGPRQSGIATHPQAYASFVALTLAPGVDRDALGRMMRLLTDDAARLTQGEPALADTEPELALLPARLTITFGFGPGLYRAAGVEERRPPSVADLPPFPEIDQLEPRWCGGDLLLQICADDPITVSHAQRMLVKDARAVRVGPLGQRGFRTRRRSPRGDPAQPDGPARRHHQPATGHRGVRTRGVAGRTAPPW